MLTAFYLLVAVAACFVILSLTVVRAHEKKLEKKEKTHDLLSDGLPEAQEDEFFTSPIYLAMEYIAHM